MKMQFGTWILLVAACGTSDLRPAVSMQDEPGNGRAMEDATSVADGLLLTESDAKHAIKQAELGDAEAAFRLSWHFSTVGDKESAKKWQLISAQNGHKVAQYNLWFDLRESDDCKELRSALLWLQKSSSSGFRSAVKALPEFQDKVKHTCENATSM